MAIKISSLRSCLHENEAFQAKNISYLKQIESELQEKLEIAAIDDYSCDLKLIFIETGGSEGLFLKEIYKLQEPYYFLTSQGDNSLAATLEIMTYLNIHHLKGECIHGDIEYISKRIKELQQLEGIKKRLSTMKLGVIGTPSDWLISSVPEYSLVKNTLGITLKNIPLKEVEESFKKNTLSFLNLENKEFDQKALMDANKVYLALDHIAKENELSGFTLRCFDLLNSIKTTGCLGLSLLNKSGIIATCEGDIMAMISMVLLNAVSNEPVFQANPSRINVKDNKIVFAHCTLPLNMCESYRYDTHFESGMGVAIKGELKCTDVTVFRMSSDLKRYFVSEGRILTNLDDKTLCRTQIEVAMEEDVGTLLKNPCGNHHIICYGRHKKAIEELLNYLLK